MKDVRAEERPRDRRRACETPTRIARWKTAGRRGPAPSPCAAAAERAARRQRRRNPRRPERETATARRGRRRDDGILARSVDASADPARRARRARERPGSPIERQAERHDRQRGERGAVRAARGHAVAARRGRRSRRSGESPRLRGRAPAPASRERSPHGIAALSPHQFGSRADSIVIANRVRAPRRGCAPAGAPPKPAHASAPAIGAPREQREPHELADHADVVGMPEDAIRAAERPARTRAGRARETSIDRRASRWPSTSAPWRRRRRRFRRTPRRRTPLPRTHASSTIARKHAGYASCIDAVDVIGGLARTRRAQPRVRWPLNAGFEEHRDEGDRAGSRETGIRSGFTGRIAGSRRG